MQQSIPAIAGHYTSWWKTACAVALLCLAAAIASPAQTFTTLVNFNGTDGANPGYISFVQNTDGNLYGTTEYGGANNYGTVFKVTPSGTLTTLHSFAGYPTDGAIPVAGLVQAINGNFYGTTFPSGAIGYGTVFSITSGGMLTTLHSFDLTDGAAPSAALVQATNGTFYGTTSGGGANNLGTVFSITSGGTLTVLHSFDLTDGAYPLGGLVQATNGTFYGNRVRRGQRRWHDLQPGCGPSRVRGNAAHFRQGGSRRHYPGNEPDRRHQRHV